MHYLNLLLTLDKLIIIWGKIMRKLGENHRESDVANNTMQSCINQSISLADHDKVSKLPDYDNYDVSEVPQSGSRIKVARDFEDMAKVFALRASACFDDPEHLYGKHFDGSDFCATHLLGYVDGEPVGTIRIRYFAEFTRIERLCIRPTHRKSRISFKLAKAAFAFCRDKGYKKLSGVAREELVPFWAMLGFKIDENQAPIYIYGQAHYEMKLIYTDAPNAVTADSPPLQLLRPEGKWHSAGYHETINVTKAEPASIMLAQARETPREIAKRLSDIKVSKNRTTAGKPLTRDDGSIPSKAN
jgi:GNAT superfamily N-acetyltransferase